jgi:hypothetical protein
MLFHGFLRAMPIRRVAGAICVLRGVIKDRLSATLRALATFEAS